MNEIAEPEISGQWILWLESHDRSYWNIHALSIDTKSEVNLSTNFPYDYNYHNRERFRASIHGDKIVWSEPFFSHYYNLCIYDLKADEKEVLLTNKSWLSNPDIYGNRIVYTSDDIIYMNTQLFIYDLSEKEERWLFNITEDNSHLNMRVNIFKNKIFYTALSYGRPYYGNIAIYYLDTEDEILLSNEDGKYNMDMFDSRIVWQERRVHDNDIFMYDLQLKEEYMISSSLTHETAPRIFGDKVVWQDRHRRDGNWTTDIYLYNITEGKERCLTPGNRSKWGPGIYNDMVLWRNGSYSLELLDLREEPVPDDGPIDNEDGPTNGNEEGSTRPSFDFLTATGSWIVALIIVVVVVLVLIYNYQRSSKLTRK
jgi:beta propeller repeat protein